jgi:hypothetical protein
MTKLWSPGDSLVLRNTGFFVGEVWGTPHVVVSDTDELVMLFRPEGTDGAVWLLEEQRRKEMRSRMDMLRLMYPGRSYAVELYFDTGRSAPYPDFVGEGRFRGWKVNIEGPLRRTEVGFDTTDDMLDIFVRPDRSFYWTDADELEYWVRNGGYTEADRARFFAAGREAQALIQVQLSPFDDEWTDWRPPADFRRPVLPEGWQFEPGADIISSTGRRYDSWRPGQDVKAVIEEWYRLLDYTREDPLRRRFVPSWDQ